MNSIEKDLFAEIEAIEVSGELQTELPLGIGFLPVQSMLEYAE